MGRAEKWRKIYVAGGSGKVKKKSFRWGEQKSEKKNHVDGGSGEVEKVM
jgi:hypothetical protein